MFIADGADKTKWNNLSQKSNWLDKNNHPTIRIASYIHFWNSNRYKQLSSLNNNSGKITSL